MVSTADEARLGALIEPGQPSPRGATPSGRGINFAIHSSVATAVELCLYDRGNGAARGSVRLPARTGDVWHGHLPAPLAAVGDLYGYRVHGPFAPQRGSRCNARKLLLDPCARAVTGVPELAPSLYDHGPGAELDSAVAMPRCRIIDPWFDWRDDRLPATPWRDSVIYELHVRGFTALHPLVPPPLRGTYLGLAEPAVIDWLTRLGITAVELLPCQAFMSEAFLRARGLVNYWGYNPIAWSAPAPDYALDDPVAEFRAMVRGLHAAGIEVILDMVYNHTAEGAERGPTFALKGCDNAAYYRLAGDDLRRYENLTGCGNTVNAAHPATQALILDSLRWWAESMHVDGFRFDLATVLGRGGEGFERDAPLLMALPTDAVLAGRKLIAEPWDVGPGGYQLGQFPAPWREWNDRYRDTVRSFWRGEQQAVGDFAERIAGSSDLYRERARSPTASVNFVTAHDGFTLADLVSYNERHNEANLEQNADGHADNRSWNCGVEGPTADPAIGALRRRQIRNLMATLLLSQGVPMLAAGDELGRSQLGNNNAYCQNNATSWVDWSLTASAAGLTEFVRELIAFRRRRPELRRVSFLGGDGSGGDPDVVWLRPDGAEMRTADWRAPLAAALGVMLTGADGAAAAVVILANGSGQSLEFRLPAALHAAQWRTIADTAGPRIATPSAATWWLASHSLVVLERS